MLIRSLDTHLQISELDALGWDSPTLSMTLRFLNFLRRAEVLQTTASALCLVELVNLSNEQTACHTEGKFTPLQSQAVRNKASAD